MSAREQGFILFGVIVIVTVVALAAFLLVREGALETRLAAAGLEREGVRYAAEAALELGRFHLLETACEGYTELAPTPFGDFTLAASSGTAVLEPGTSVSLSFPTNHDTWLKQASPSETHGADNEIRSKKKSGDTDRALLRFDLTGLPAEAVVDSAVAFLRVSNEDGTSNPVEVHRVTDAWSEGTATWANTGSDVDAAVHATYSAKDEGWSTALLTFLVRFWAAGLLPNHGVAMLPTSSDKEHKLTSKEWSNASERPRLDVVATVGASAFVPMLATATDSDGHVSTLQSDVAVPIGPAEALLLRDEVNAAGYAGDDGSDPWSGPWVEVGESDGPASGRVRALSTAYCVATACLRLGGDDVSLTGRSIEREAELTGADVAVLSFRYRRQRLDGSGGSVLLQASANGGASYTTLTTYALSATDGSPITEAFDLSPFIGAETRIRFLGSGTVESYFHVDDVQIEASVPCEPGPAATEDTATLFATADTYLENGDTSANGGAADLFVGRAVVGTQQNVLVRFDVLATLPAGVPIVAATLRLYEAATLGQAFAAPVHRLTQSWVESQATWTNAASGTPWSGGPGGSYNAAAVDTVTLPAGSGWREWNVTPLVQEWVDGVSPDHGVIVAQPGVLLGTSARFNARENAAVQRPELVVTYEP